YRANNAIFTVSESYKTLGTPTLLEPGEREFFEAMLGNDPTLFEDKLAWDPEEEIG
ncbi:hypothetical protein DFH28DRAFT_871400, partial [Melampsora americana]